MPFIIFLPKKQRIYDYFGIHYFYEFASEALHIVIFKFFVKSMPSWLLKLKVMPSFCFPFKIPDSLTATNKHWTLQWQTSMDLSRLVADLLYSIQVYKNKKTLSAMISTHCDLDCVGTLKYGQDNGLFNVFDAKALVSFFGCCSFIDWMIVLQWSLIFSWAACQ